MTRIYVIRHAEAEGNLYRRLHGQYDSLVTPNGKRQIAALEQRFASEQVDACYSSDLIRTRLTARAIYVPKRLPLHPDRRFREINMGVWEDVPFGYVGHFTPEALDTFNLNPAAWQVAGCESYLAYSGRFIEAMTEAAEANDGKTIAIFSHGSVIRGMMMRLFYGAEHPEETGHCDNTGVTLLEYDNGSYHLIYKNDNTHLSPEISTLAQQNWWKENGQKLDHNLWYRPVGGDQETYLAFRRNAWQNLYGNLDGFLEEGFWQDACHCAAQQPKALVFAMLGDQIVGVLQLDLDRKVSQNAGYIPFYYMTPEARNHGFGVQLLGHAISVCRPLGRSSLQLAVSPRNAQALRFYRRYGFSEIGHTPGHCEDLILMELSIDRTPYQL